MDEKESVIHTPAPTRDEQTMAFLAEFLQIFTGFIAPLVIYLMKQESRFVSFHAMQALLWQIIFFVLLMGVFTVAFVGMFAAFATHPQSSGHPQEPPSAFFLLFPLIWLAAMGGWVLNLIIGIVYGIKAIRGEWAAYPVIGRWARRIVGA
ncbi:MAG TPA: DUF4870 domain-containing protein [Candidatus Acidoferrales bacterium]|nr:DUF4870 domain-containing protein [Candidatus Acidoferrales bacterium]